MLHVYHVLPRSLSISLIFLSLSSIHILRIESLIHTLRAWDRVQFRARPFAHQWSFAGGRSCFISNSFDFLIASSWQGGSISHPSKRMSCILPQDRGKINKKIRHNAANLMTICLIRLNLSWHYKTWMMVLIHIILNLCLPFSSLASLCFRDKQVLVKKTFGSKVHYSSYNLNIGPFGYLTFSFVIQMPDNSLLFEPCLE